MKRAAFSLLEVILALAILAGALAVLGEAARMAMRNAAAARDLSRAQLLGESVMAQVVLGAVPLESAPATPIEPLSELDEGGWLYSLDVQSTEREGLLRVCVTVMPDQAPESRPIRFSSTRLIVDPTWTPSTATTTTTNSSNTTQPSSQQP
jgi:type II secretion system protein I